MWRRFLDALTDGGRQGRLAVLALAAAGFAVVVIGVAAAAQQVAPEPPSPVVGSVPTPIPTGSTHAGDGPGTKVTSTPKATHGHQSAARNTPAHKRKAAHAHKPAQKTSHHGEPALVLPASKPVHVTVPAIGVNTDLTTVGLTDSGAVDVPHGAVINEAAWFRQSPTPGQYGPSVIVGHIDTVNGPSVFFRLGALRPGDKINVTRADGRTTVFTVDGLAQYPDRTKLPIQAIYGGDVNRAELRLMTCANFDSSIGHYRGNTVVFAHLTSVRGH